MPKTGSKTPLQCMDTGYNSILCKWYQYGTIIINFAVSKILVFTQSFYPLCIDWMWVLLFNNRAGSVEWDPNTGGLLAC